MASFNKVILMGNLTRDPELRYTPSGTAIAGFGIATNRRWKDQDGNQKEEVTYIDITAFGKQAEVIGQYFQKGKGIHIEGRLKFDQWDDKNTGQKRSKLGVVLDRFEFIGGGQGDEGSPAPQQSAPPPPSQPADGPPADGPPADGPPADGPPTDGPPVDGPGDDDVPF